jgi:hypothetical protein
MPLESVVAVVTFLLVSENFPLAPLAGAVNVTTTPLVGDPLVVTVATIGVPNAPSTAWLCGVPLAAATTGETLFAGAGGTTVVQFTVAIR